MAADIVSAPDVIRDHIKAGREHHDRLTAAGYAMNELLIGAKIPVARERKDWHVLSEGVRFTHHYNWSGGRLEVSVRNPAPGGFHIALTMHHKHAGSPSDEQYEFKEHCTSVEEALDVLKRWAGKTRARDTKP